MKFVSILGLLTLLGLAWALSFDRRGVRLQPILWGIGLQLVLALAILRQDAWSFIGMATLGLLVVCFLASPEQRAQGPAWRAWLRPTVAALLIASGLGFMISRGYHGQIAFEALGGRVSDLLSLADYGSRFLFGNLADERYYFPADGSAWPGFGYLFAFKLLPVIIFFGGLMGVLYYLGIVQVVIVALSRFMRWTLGTSGAETLSCSANIFIGQTEAPLVVRPYLATATRSELLTIMVGGFATVAGGILAIYIQMGVPAAHLLAATVMSAPAALVIGKIIYPESERSETGGDVEIPKAEVGTNIIEAATSGISDGLKLAANVGAMLIGFITLIALVDVILNFCDGWIDGRLLGGAHVTYEASSLSPIAAEFRGVFPGSLRTLFGTLLQPLAFLMGVPWAEAAQVGHLLGVKLSLNELVAYGILGSHIQAGDLSDRAIIISSYALCGFANFASIGIQIGGLSALAPNRRRDLAELGLRAMLGGALASWLTATIAGLFI